MKLSKFCLAVFSVLVTLCLIELGLRLTIQSPVQVTPPPVLDPDYGWRLPGHARIFVNDLHREVRIERWTNALGFYDNDHTETRPPGVRRILFVGDSFTDGGHVPLDQHFARRVEALVEGERLNQTQWECMAMGAAGWGTAQEIKVYEKLGRAFDPEIVILGFCIDNDLADNHPALAQISLRPVYRLVDGRLVFQPIDTAVVAGTAAMKSKQRRHWTTAWLYRTYLYTWKRAVMVQVRARLREWSPYVYVKKKLGRWKDKTYRDWNDFSVDPPPDQAALWSESIDVTIRQLADFRDRLAAENRKLLVYFIPSRIQIYDDWLKQAQTYYTNIHPDVIDLERPNRILSERLTAESVETVDLLPAFREHARSGRTRLYFKYDGHFTSEGHAEAARVIHEKLEGLGWVK
ncbi:SGNH/GDSL hydrolase family protein [bacterium]|nr:SGNH/GDSL hydrolase family protein [bacterium]